MQRCETHIANTNFLLDAEFWQRARLRRALSAEYLATIATVMFAQCEREFRTTMVTAYAVMPAGRRVRCKHCVCFLQFGERVTFSLQNRHCVLRPNIEKRDENGALDA